MTQRLTVDTSRLAGAGSTLQGLAFPDHPAPITVVGTDSVSAAVNETMPVIESPVLEGMPVAGAALVKTASNMSAAAGMYADADHLLGRPLAEQEFAALPSVAGRRADAAPADQQAFGASSDESQGEAAADQPADTAAPSPRDVLQELPPAVMELAPQVNQIASTAGTFTQSIVQGVQGTTQNQPLTGQLDAEPEEQPEQTEGAAPGAQESEGVPIPVGVDATGERPSASSPATARGEQP